MATYNNDSYLYPFWAENNGFMTGRDPLGVQNSSIRTYGRLLPGMTNLTLRLRYYGFYMWVLNEYELNFKRSNITVREHYNTIRRAELLLAFIMNKLHPAEQSIIGSDFTKNKVNTIFSSGTYQIDLGADKLEKTPKSSVYWDYESGALGQYYGGSLVGLKLIIINGKFFEIQDKGRELAKAYDDNIAATQKAEFLNAMKTGKIDEDTIVSLTDFAVNKINVKSAEWDFYCKILLSEDGQDFFDSHGNVTFLRKETIQLFLNFLDKNNSTYNERSFIKWQYNQNQETKTVDSAFGWYYYYVNEAFHIALETIFWTMLVELQSKGKAVEEFIAETTAYAVEGCKSTFLPNIPISLNESINSCKSYSIHEVLENLEIELKSEINSKTAIVLAYKLMLTIYANIVEHIEDFHSFEKNYKIAEQKGRVTENLTIYIDNERDNNYQEFVKETIKKVINDHINTAYRKMGNGEKNLLKFIIEDGIIYHVQTMAPRHTSPRLRALENFLTDLSFINRDKQLTSDGLQFLKSIV